MLVSHAIGIVSGAVTSSAEVRVPGRRRVHAGASFSALALRLQLQNVWIRAIALSKNGRGSREKRGSSQQRVSSTVGRHQNPLLGICSRSLEPLRHASTNNNTMRVRSDHREHFFYIREISAPSSREQCGHDALSGDPVRGLPAELSSTNDL